jgi:hypothetical protein
MEEEKEEKEYGPRKAYFFNDLVRPQKGFLNT